MRCQDCGGTDAYYRFVTVAGACCDGCWADRDREWRRAQIRDGETPHTDDDHHPSPALFAPEDPTPELSVDGWVGGAA